MPSLILCSFIINSEESMEPTAIACQNQILFQYISYLTRGSTIGCKEPNPRDPHPEILNVFFKRVIVNHYNKMSLMDRVAIIPPDKIQEEHFEAIRESVKATLTQTNGTFEIDLSKTNPPEGWKIKKENLKVAIQAIQEFAVAQPSKEISFIMRRVGVDDDNVRFLYPLFELENLEVVDLSYNRISDDGFRRLARKAGRLPKLILKNNKITDGSLSNLSDLITANTTISVDLRGNPISKEELKKIVANKILPTITF